MRNINETLSTHLRRRISFASLKDELDNVLDYSVNSDYYSTVGYFISDICDNLVDNIIEDIKVTPKEKDDLYYYLIDTFGDYISKQYHKVSKPKIDESNNLHNKIKKVIHEFTRTIK